MFIYIILVYGIPFKYGLLVLLQKNLKFISYLNINIFFNVNKILSFLCYVNNECWIIIVALLADWSSSVPPDIYSFAPFIYDISLQADHAELLVPCNQGNWIDCENENNQKQQSSSENSKRSYFSFNFIQLFIIFKITSQLVLSHFQ